jgi:UDPglucose--hexose-1-phosphate uridylyltransferase
MHKKRLTKPDGRALHLYGLEEIPEGIVPTSPSSEPLRPEPHFRWHPLRGEWVAFASHRQERTFLPPKGYSPLAPSTNPALPTEMPVGKYDVAVFENLFPSMQPRAERVPTFLQIPVLPAKGICEVVVFTKDPDTSLGRLPVEKIALVLEVLRDRTLELAQSGVVSYVMPFENRGVEMGVTLHHPHGQIYGYPFVPPVPALFHQKMLEYREREGRGLLEDMVAKEIAEGTRLVHRQDGFASFVPACARYPYETWIVPEVPYGWLPDMDDDALLMLARALKTTLLKLDGLWERPMPYLMIFYQAPAEKSGQPLPKEGFHFHIQITPPYRARDRLKYLAGTELGAGLFVNDTLPEEKAAELRAVPIEETVGEA